MLYIFHNYVIGVVHLIMFFNPKDLNMICFSNDNIVLC